MITVKVLPDGGEPYDLTCTMRDVVMWEKTHRKRMAQLAQPAATDLYEIAHIAARRQGVFTGTLDEFLSTVDLEQEDDEDDEADPTQLAP